MRRTKHGDAVFQLYHKARQDGLTGHTLQWGTLLFFHLPNRYT